MRKSDIRNRKNRERKDPLTAGAAMIVQAAMKEDVSVGDLADLAERDPSFAVRLLSLVNSPAFARKQKLSSIRQAASFLGIRGLRNLALSLVVSDMVPNSDDASVLLENSLRRALAAHRLAIALQEKEPDFYFTTGLLLETGTLIHAREDLAEAIRVASIPASERQLFERALGVSSHPAAGASFARNFSLPQEMVSAIEDHHSSEMPAERGSAICWAAEFMAAVFEGGAYSTLERRALEAAAAVGVDEATARTILEELPESVTEAGAGFQRKLRSQPPLATLAEDATRALIELNGQYEDVIQTLHRVLGERERLASHLKQINDDLARLAITDPLTGLPNKRGLEHTLHRDLAQVERENGELSLLVLDIDHFKKFNDTWGHKTGDDVLTAVGRTLREYVRAGDLAARYGGEEFVVVLPRTNEADAEVVADRIRAAIEAMEVPGPKGPLKVTTSIGSATVRGANLTSAADTLFKRADTALYEAKSAGRNCVRAAA
ncbi:MAG: diguanylate cyclase [Myxococcota bacterium]